LDYLHIFELVPKLIDYALKRMVRTFGSMEQAFAVFRPMAYKTAVFKGSWTSGACLPKN
jgi:hypothetical protein